MDAKWETTRCRKRADCLLLLTVLKSLLADLKADGKSYMLEDCSSTSTLM